MLMPLGIAPPLGMTLTNVYLIPETLDHEELKFLGERRLSLKDSKEFRGWLCGRLLHCKFPSENNSYFMGLGCMIILTATATLFISPNPGKFPWLLLFWASTD